TVAIANSSPRSAKCAGRALPICSSPRWVRTRGQRSEVRRQWGKRNEYGKKYWEPIKSGINDPGYSNPAVLLVGEARIMGKPFDLYGAADRRGPGDLRVRSQRSLVAAPPTQCSGARSGAPTSRD